MRFANNNNNGVSQGCVRAPDATDHDTDVSAKSTAPLPQPSATSGHGELHELHVAKSTAENNQKGNQATMATMLGGSSSLFLVYFVAVVQRHLQALHIYYSVSSGFVWTDTFLEPIPCGRKTFFKLTSVQNRFCLRSDGALVHAR